MNPDLQPIAAIAASVGIPASALYAYGPYKAKLTYDYLAKLPPQPRGKLILVTAINPTAAGEGKTTTSIGLGDALRLTGRKTIICLREPSLGPCFGAKGGATGGGKARVAPADEINLHFTGDFHAITTAHNLLAALIDNHIYWGNALGFDARRVRWRRVLDLNDRALRQTVIGLGDNGAPREDGFDITVASPVMAILCLAESLDDLQERLGAIVIGETRDRQLIRVRDLGAEKPMSVLLRDAFQPNLVQTLEGTPALIHGGPFANIAHGCNSLLATQTGLRLADYVVTEAGFGADLGAEKFLNIKCRKSGLAPSAAVVVATVRALKLHGGVAKDALAAENVTAVTAGCSNLLRHIDNLRGFNLPVVVAINRFTADTQAELDAIIAAVGDRCPVVPCNHWAEGGAGAITLAETVARIAEAPAMLQLTYPDTASLAEKIRTVAQRIYGAADITLEPQAAKQLAHFEAAGFGALPVCMAKTQYSFSTNPEARGAPTGFTIPVREIRLCGAEFVVALCGDIMTMPGLPRVPASDGIHLDADRNIVGLL
ncbi:MAG: formate--tetrahydrofolate ligase [Alphaproteobacteria bacterium]|nr:formate--tetrahydrofolate ligase [Alphaproteobacteria bacterium]